MAPLPDVTNPVVINASTTTLIQSDYFLRRVCFVSFGDTLLEAGKYQLVDRTDFANILGKQTNETAVRLNTFFNYATNKMCGVLELGVQPNTPIADTYESLGNFLATLNKDYYADYLSAIYAIWEAGGNETYAVLHSYATVLHASEFKENEWFAYIYNKWFSSNESEEDIKNFFSAQHSADFVQANYETWLTEQRKTDSLESLKEYVVSLNLSHWPVDYYAHLSTSKDSFKALLTAANLKAYLGSVSIPHADGYYTYLDGSSASFQALKTLESLKTFASSLTGYTAESYNAWRVAQGNFDTDYSAKIAALKAYIDGGSTRNYIYILPASLYAYNGTAGLVGQYSQPNDKLYFMLKVADDPSTSENFKRFAGMKSFIGVYDNGDATNSLAGAIAGKFSSNIFDIGPALKASPLNYKTILGFNYKELDKSLQRSLNDSGVSFASSLVGNPVIMNGRCGDLRPFDYWYQWDLTAYNIDQKLTALLLNGINNPNYIVQYNQNGIDTVNATIVSTLNNMISEGCVTEFGATYDPATNTLTNIGFTLAIDFYTYISVNPLDYQNEVYGGISFYIRIGRYIRQVVINVTLG